MTDIVTTPNLLLGLGALIGFLLGFASRGIGALRRIKAARDEGIILARTSINGDGQLEAEVDRLICERDRLKQRVEALTAKAAAQIRPTADTGGSGAIAETDDSLVVPITRIDQIRSSRATTTPADPNLSEPPLLLRRPAFAAALKELSANADRSSYDQPDQSPASDAGPVEVAAAEEEEPAPAQATDPQVEPLFRQHAEAESSGTSGIFDTADEPALTEPRRLLFSRVLSGDNSDSEYSAEPRDTDQNPTLGRRLQLHPDRADSSRLLDLTDEDVAYTAVAVDRAKK